ncbi:MAG: phosphatase PAP2 family protein [Prevotella sp.]|nr:phosphatase PAP2 family protein [Prevotella sp.]
MRKILLLISLVLLPLWVVAQESDKPYHGDGPDDVLRFVPIASVFALKACGVEGASSWKRLVVNTATSYALSVGTAWALKHSIHERRPDGTDQHAFPSGHATVAFAGAHILHKEYGHYSPWISVAGYGVATAVSIDRIARNRHQWHDVCVGAAIGVLGTELGYWLGDKITGERSRYVLSVGPEGLSLVINY